MKSNRYEARKIRHFRIRKKITGSELRPRLNVFRSNRNLYAQIIDDSQHRALVSYSTLQMAGTGKSNLNKASATLLGEMLAKKALENNITTVVFDRGGGGTCITGKLLRLRRLQENMDWNFSRGEVC